MPESDHASKGKTLRLNAPTKLVFWIAVALMVAGVLIFYLDVFDQHRHIGFWLSTFGGLALVAGSTLKGV
jgi:hypothetical protein